ncbi:hypothetical protein J5500_03030 [Candidatus Saccharibacteria bacterium]|nr:hypothetical protein [Candidatus Saccharibacteria bacterium]
MISFTERQLTQTCPDCVEQFKCIQRIINEATFTNVNKVSCHVLCIAIGELFNLEIKHGYYLPGLEHSWCVDRYGNILDIYPWGTIGGPTLIVRTIASFQKSSGMYKEYDGLEVLTDPQTRVDADIAKAEIVCLLKPTE